MTQEQFAQELGITGRTIRNYERGAHQLKLSLGQFKRLKELLEQAGMSIDDLPDDIDWGGISSSDVSRLDSKKDRVSWRRSHWECFIVMMIVIVFWERAIRHKRKYAIAPLLWKAFSELTHEAIEIAATHKGSIAPCWNMRATCFVWETTP